jgi:hypothetical protein
MDWADKIAAQCIGDGTGEGDTIRLIAAALRAEREACAKQVSGMKLYIWSNPYSVSYGSSMVIAIADNVDKAREIAKTAPAYSYNEYEDKAPLWSELKEPTRVVELPCAEWHVWQE